MSYLAPLRDMRFVLDELAGLGQLQRLPGFEEASDETVDAIFEECAKLTSEVIAPLNASGDRQPSSWADGRVTTSPGFRAAFRSFVEGGWQGLQHPTRLRRPGTAQGDRDALPGDAAGGQPVVCAVPAAHRRHDRGADDGRHRASSSRRYVPHLIDGSWTGTMNLTEPQAGSDLAQVRTRAERQADGSYRIFGRRSSSPTASTTWPQNIVHLVLARTPDAPEGVKGLSLFVVPKFVVGPDGAVRRAQRRVSAHRSSTSWASRRARLRC